MSSRRAFVALAAVLAAVPVAFAEAVRAHGGGVETPPVPVLLVVVGAAVAVAATALALAVGADPPSSGLPFASVPASVVAWAHRGVRVVVVLALAAAVLSTAAADAGVTFAVAFLWPVLFKGSLVVAAVVGSPWRVVSPWEIAYDAVTALEGEAVALRSYPERLGSWPAVVGFLAMVGVVENLTVVPSNGSLAVAVFASYALVAFLGAIAFGREWFERADAFTVLYGLVGRVAPLDWTREDGRVTLAVRPPWTSSARPLADAGLGAFVVVALATVTYDGAAETVVAASARQRLAAAVGPFADLVLYATVLVAFVAGAVVVARAVLAAAGSTVDSDPDRDDRDRDDRDRDDSAALGVGRRLAATLLPIAVAYDVAHNYPYVLVNAGRVLERALDAAGSTVAIDVTALLAPTVVWTTQVGLVIGGHVVAVVAAHVATVRAFPDAERARRGHAPLAALMVAYTVASLYVLATP